MAIWFSHVALNCRDMAATERYYTTHFGFKRARVFSLGDSQLVFLKAGEVYLELFAAEGDAPAPASDGPKAPGVRHLAFQVDNVDEVLSRMGEDAKVTLGPLDFDELLPGWRTVWVQDPDGNIVEVSQGYTDEENLSAPS